MAKKILALAILVGILLLLLTFNNPASENNTPSFQQPPQEPATKYIHAVDWPPKLATSTTPWSCTPGGKDIMENGMTSKKNLGGQNVCENIMSEGAAGSIYTTYNYSWARGGQTVSLSFTLRMVQCDNYDDPNKSECKQERANFDPESLASEMIGNVK